MEQARNMVRRPFIPITVRDPRSKTSERYTDYIIELNKSRMFIRTERTMPIGTKLEVEFHLKDLPRPLILKGEVIRTSKGTEVGTRALGAGMGILFRNVNFDDIKMLNDHLKVVGDGQKAEEFEHFANWVKSLKGPVSSEQKEKVKKEWLSQIIEAARGEVGDKKAEPKKKSVEVKPGDEIEPLKRIQLFEELSDEQLSELADICHKEFFKPEEIIFEEDAIGDKFYMLEKGEVRISKIIQGIGEEALVVLKEGAYFGEMALIDEAPRSATAICNDEATLWVINKEDFEKLLSEDSELASKLLWTFVKTLSVRLRETNEKIKSFFAMTGGNQW